MGIMCQEDTAFAQTMTKDVIVRVVFSNDVAMSIEKDMKGNVDKLVIMMGSTRQFINVINHNKSETEIINFTETQYIGLKRSFELADFEKRFIIMTNLSWQIKYYIEN